MDTPDSNHLAPYFLEPSLRMLAPAPVTTAHVPAEHEDKGIARWHRRPSREARGSGVPERKGDDPRRREERFAALLDDPEKLRELHRRQIERREARKAAKRRRKGRYQVRSMRMQRLTGVLTAAPPSSS